MGNNLKIAQSAINTHTACAACRVGKETHITPPRSSSPVSQTSPPHLVSRVGLGNQGGSLVFLHHSAFSPLFSWHQFAAEWCTIRFISVHMHRNGFWNCRKISVSAVQILFDWMPEKNFLWLFPPFPAHCWLAGWNEAEAFFPLTCNKLKFNSLLTISTCV